MSLLLMEILFEKDNSLISISSRFISTCTGKSCALATLIIRKVGVSGA